MASLSRRRKRLLSGFWATVLAVMLIVPVPLVAATTERIVVDWHTGLAISGFDPVAYFTDSAAVPGKADYEYGSGGARWRFRNEGNRAAFAANPEVYAPQFGGYDPIVLARGVATPGHPEIWLIAEKKLYLFYSAEDRAAFAADTETAAGAAEERWPQVERTLVP